MKTNPATHRVLITISGGAVQAVYADGPVEVLIQDYDTGNDEEWPGLARDINGDLWQPVHFAPAEISVAPIATDTINAAWAEYAAVQS